MHVNLPLRRLAFALLALSLTPLAGCADANSSNSAGSVMSAGLANCSYPSDGDPARPVDPPQTTGVPAAGKVTASIELTAGTIDVTMDRAKAPCTVNSFLSLVEQKYYDNTDCHRLVDHGIFILQCGDPTATGTGGPGYTIPDEVKPNTTYPAGTIAMAKRQAPNTGGSQFFFVYADTDLPAEYTVLGTMDQRGIDLIGEIASQGVDATDGTTPIAEAKISSISLG